MNNIDRAEPSSRMHRAESIAPAGEARHGLSRRRFMQSATGATAASVLSAERAARAMANNERLRIGMIGPGQRGFGAHLKTLARLRKMGSNIDVAAVADVYQVHVERAQKFLKDETGQQPVGYRDYRHMLAKEKLDAVCIATPDHWHARQTIDCLKAGLHVYCEKPMTHTLEESAEVVRAWKASGRVMQVGVQSTSSPIWDKARELIDAGKLGKVVQFQTEYFRNSRLGMTRHNLITPEMTPQAIDWRQWLGVDEGLAPEMPFDRETYAQWRCYWPFSCGMFGDLFVHRVTVMLKATGLRMPGRVVGGGGIFLEYDDRQVPDVASIIADYHEGVQGVVSSTMTSCEVKLDHVIRGHSGSIVFTPSAYGGGPKAAFEFIPERPQVTGDSKSQRERIHANATLDFDAAHFSNFIEAARAGKPDAVNNDPELGAAAVTMVSLAVRSYREGKVFQIDRDGRLRDGDASWALAWEQMSKDQARPRHVPGWHAGDAGSILYPPDYQKLKGPWKDGKKVDG
jgi:predicted dehydrogenase